MPACGLTRLLLAPFRLVARAELQLAPGLNLIAGRNAQGKTSILEAAAYLSTGRSFRTSRDADCIPWDTPPDTFAAVECDCQTAIGQQRRIRVAIQPSRKTVWLDSKPLPTLASLWGVIQTVVFVPADLQVVQGPPAGRRRLMDMLLAQTSSDHLQALQQYDRALANRNALIRRRITPNDPQYEAFEAAMARSAARLLRARASVAARLQDSAPTFLQQLCAGVETMLLGYECGFSPKSTINANTIREDPLPALEQRLRERWAATRSHDIESGVTREGPQGDDLTIHVSGKDARRFASQGQARSCILALRLAEMQLLEESAGAPPILLLDDVLGELDRERREGFLRLLKPGTQALVTTTDADTLGLSHSPGRRWIMEHGVVKSSG